MAGGKELRAGYRPFFKKAEIDPKYPGSQKRTLINDISKFRDMVNHVLSKRLEVVSLDTEASDLNQEIGELVGASFAISHNESYYIPVAHKIGKNLPLNLLLEFISELNKRVKYIFMWNSRFDMRYLRYAGIEEYVSVDELRVFDAAVIVYNTDTNIPMPSLKWSAEHYLGWQMMTFSEVVEDHPNFSFINPEECYKYACDDALATLCIPLKLRTTWKEAKFINRVDNRANWSIMKMEDDPVIIDLERVEQLKKEFEQSLVDLEKEIYRSFGFQFKINSPKVLAEALSSKGLSTGRYTDKGNISTKEEYLQAIAYLNPIVDKIIEYKKGLKMNSTYLTPLENGYDSRLSGSRFAYFSVLAPTGRLAAGQDKQNSYFMRMNIQAITKGKGCYYTARKSSSHKSILGYEFDVSEKETNIEGFKYESNLRTAFVAPEGYLWVHIDYKTQELRLPANMAKEPVLLRVFLDGEDFHEIMAIKVFGHHNIDTRKKIKPINFGALYGGTGYTYQKQLGVSLQEAEEILNGWWSAVPVLKKWVDQIHKQARREGIVYTYFGRPRRLRHWYASKNWKYISFADRSSISHRVQGTGGDIMRIQLVSIYSKLRNWINKRILLPKITVHDELNFYVRKDEAKEIIFTLMEMMAIKIKDWPVPMDVGLAVGNSWGGIYEFTVKNNDLVPGS
jgi:DNA polymerase-1